MGRKWRPCLNEIPEISSVVRVVPRIGSQRVAHIPSKFRHRQSIIVLFRIDVEFAVISVKPLSGCCGNFNAKLVFTAVRYSARCAQKDKKLKTKEQKYSATHKKRNNFHSNFTLFKFNKSNVIHERFKELQKMNNLPLVPSNLIN